MLRQEQGAEVSLKEWESRFPQWISHRARSGGSRKETKFGRNMGHTIHVDGEGLLQIHGVGNQLVEVSVSPASLDSVASKCTEFLNTSMERSTTIFAIANWKFGGLMGGVLTSFTALYVVGYTLAFLKWLVQSFVPRR